MSIISQGSKCTLCSLVDFLPFTCQECSLVYCKEHISSPLHQCLIKSLEGSTSYSKPGKLNRGKKLCGFSGCERESIESIAGIGLSGKEEIAKEIRCTGCQRAYCVEHRLQISHNCTAPLDHNVRHDAFLERRLKAKALISKQFPEYKDRIIPKPPPGKDVDIRQKLESKDPSNTASTSLHTQKQSQTTISSSEASSPNIPQPKVVEVQVEPIKPKAKSKAEKLWDIHLKKIRMTSEPLNKGSSTLSESIERVFFEWQIDLTQNKVKNWKVIGKSDIKTEKPNRAWVSHDMPIGKILDLIIERGQVKRSSNNNDPTQTLRLLSLYPIPDGERQITQLELSKSAKDQIPQGSLIVLIRGKWDDQQ
ncbi:uncharacterized protein L201_001617 [Kwoniella dendrophila CBS 6074]|uniref:AN1-type domain-containing protein n=1 Tax=Kwoniella dendrophila CBS 6074 TaxID=1295534 RepID=A0AAX4JPR4_9TREE